MVFHHSSYVKPGSGGYSKSEIDAFLMIGSANKQWISLFLELYDAVGAVRSTATAFTNTGATDVTLTMTVPLPYYCGTNVLKCSNTRIGVFDADAGDYVDRLRIKGWSDYDTIGANLVDDGTNLDSAQEKTYNHATLTIGGVYKRFFWLVGMVCTNADDLDIPYVQAEVYYDAP